jgi:hypothetical protein
MVCWRKEAGLQAVLHRRAGGEERKFRASFSGNTGEFNAHFHLHHHDAATKQLLGLIISAAGRSNRQRMIQKLREGDGGWEITGDEEELKGNQSSSSSSSSSKRLYIMQTASFGAGLNSSMFLAVLRLFDVDS